MHEPSAPEPDDSSASESGDPRNEEVTGDDGMPAEFVDTPANRPGDRSPPDAATSGE